MPHTCADFAGPNLGPQILALFASPSKVAMLLCNTKRALPCSCNAWQPCQAFMQQAPGYEITEIIILPLVTAKLNT